MTRIGFSNLSNELSISVAIRDSITQAVAQSSDMELVLRTNDMDSEKVIQHAHEFTDLGVDIAVVMNTVERASMQLGLHFKMHKTPLIAIEIPIPMSIYLGIDNTHAGQLASDVLVNWVKKFWNGKMDKLLIVTDHRHITNVQNRLKLAANKTLSALGMPSGDVLFLDGLSSRAMIAKNSDEFFARLDTETVGVICDNDDTAMGILDTIKKHKREDLVAVVGQNATLAFTEFEENPDTRLIGTIDFQPYTYGKHLVRLIEKIQAGEPYAMENKIEPRPVYKDLELNTLK